MEGLSKKEKGLMGMDNSGDCSGKKVILHLISSILYIEPSRTKCELLGLQTILLFVFNSGVPLCFITLLHRIFFSFFI